MTQPLRISWIVVVALALLLLPGKAAAQSAPATHNPAIPLSSRTTKNGSSSNLGVQGPNLLELFPAADITGYLNTARPVVSDARRLQLSERRNEGQETVYKGANCTRDDIRQPVRSKRK